MAIHTDTTNTVTLEERIEGVVHDGPDLVYKLSKLDVPEGEPIEIVTELPSTTDLDIILGYVTRWVEVQKLFKKDLRIYAWSYSLEVEKYLVGCVQPMHHIAITPLPIYLREGKKYGK